MASDTSAPPALTKDPLLIYNWACPYVHRVSLALAFKQASIAKVAIDLMNKPSWLPCYSPHGKVPAITYLEDGQQQVLYESLVLIVWVDEYYPGPALLPESYAQRALARIIYKRFDSMAVPKYYEALKCRDEDGIVEPLAKLREEFTWLEKHSALATDPNSPFLLGAKPTLVDVVVAPHLLRAPLFQHFRNIDLLGQHPKLQAYTDRFRQVPEVQATFLPPGGGGLEAWVQGMNEAYVPFAKERLDFSPVDA